MSSSTSNSSLEPTVTVVIGSNAPPERLTACLEALEPQRDGVEVLVYEGAPSPPELRERFAWATFVTTPGALVPHEWRDGIDAARNEIVALTIAQMVPASDWVATIRRALAARDLVAGAIEPGERLRVVDWAEYFCRYSRDMLPFRDRETPDLPGDNAAYRRVRIETVRETYRDGFWEPDVHRALAADGIPLTQTRELVVFQGRSAGFTAFARQRMRHGRAYGQQRGVRFSTGRNVVGVLAWPLVPLLMTLRVGKLVLRKGRYRARLAIALPAVIAFNTVWAVNEALGHLDVLRGR